MTEDQIDVAPFNPDLYDVDVLMVGAGIFGSVIGAQLESIGRDVFYIDADQSLRGSRPAACLIRPSWLSKMGKETYEPALKTLDQLYGLKSLTFRTRPLNREVHVHWIDPADILKTENVHRGYVRAISHETVKIGPPGATKNGRPIAKLKLNTGWWNVRANIIVVATGIWTNKLFPHVEVKAQMGAAFVWENSTIEDNFISVWAPYRQLLGMNQWQPNTVWCGDGSVIIKKNFNQERIAQSAARCARATGLEASKARILVGARPYTERSPYYLEEVLSGVFIATGGAKNGTAAAGAVARAISQAVT